MFHYQKFEYTDVFIFDEFLVSQIHEGAHITPDDNEKLRKLIDHHFTNKDVVYISNRHFSYAVDPLTYLGTSKIHRLKGIAIVTTDPLKESNAYYESKFYNKPFEVFPTLSLATRWVHSLLSNTETSRIEKSA